MMGNLLGMGVRLRLLHVLEDWTISLIEAGEAGVSDLEAVRLAELLKAWSRRSVNVDDVAGELRWSVRKAQRICNRRFGCGIIKLHEKMRIEYAWRLLLNSDMNVCEVANSCGFSDPYNFSRTFTKIAGMPPSVFKRKIKSG